jgi:RNA-binding protein
MQLSEKQKRFLRGLGHQRHPIVTIGQKGMRETIMEEIKQALLTHELVKIKINMGEHSERDAVVAEISEASGAALVQRIGNTALYYRANPKKKKDPIKLP